MENTQIDKFDEWWAINGIKINPPVLEQAMKEIAMKGWAAAMKIYSDQVPFIPNEELSNSERKALVEALVFAASTDACLDDNSFNPHDAIELAAKFNDPSIELNCYLFNGGVYYDEISTEITNRIPQIRVDS